MTEVVFYEKPGCAGNARQRRLLEAAGHTLVVRDLLTEPWTPDRLRPYFAGRPVTEWFNKTAARVKSGEIEPEQYDGDTALALLAADPRLIRRPLIEANGHQAAGFDGEPVLSLLGDRPSEDTEACRRHASAPDRASQPHPSLETAS